MMMGIVFRLWAMGIQAGVLICIVLAVRVCLKKYPKIYSYSLWALVGFCLLCPVRIESPFSLLPDLSFAETVQRTVLPEQSASDAQPVQMSEDKALAEAPETKVWVKRAQLQDASVPAGEQEKESLAGMNARKRKEGLFIEFIDRLNAGEMSAADAFKLPAVLYITVALCLLAFYMGQYLCMKQKLSTAVWEQDHIWVSGEIRSPFVMGIIAPRIYLPSSVFYDSFFYDSTFIDNIPDDNGGFSSVEKRCILEHERTHIRHRDPLIRMTGILCICLHWWNPLVWLAVSKMNEDMEMYCDETVLRAASAKQRKEYANALLSFAEKKSGIRAGLAFGESHTEKRIKNLLNKRQKDWRISFFSAFLAIFCAASLMTVPKRTANSQAKTGADFPITPDVHTEDTENDQNAVNEDIQTSPFAYTEYTGYMDECREWVGYTAFVGQDYDGDGQTDRVFRTWREGSEYCHYQIQFGNKDVLDCDKDVYAQGSPSIEAADINGDGENEIILLLQYDMATDMRGVGDLAVFEKKGNAYVRAELPFAESEEGYSQEAPMHFHKKREQLITVSLDGMDFQVDVPINHMLWEEARYRDLFADTDGCASIWDMILAEDGQDVKLACKLRLFDKWSEYGLILLLGYEDQRYVVEEAFTDSDPFSDSLPDTRGTWELRDYRLSGKKMKLADGEPVIVELWLKEGKYIAGDDVVQGGGVYEENYQGEYMLMTKDRNGNVLDTYDLNRQGEDSPEWDVFGVRTNFSGPFEIMEADYNGDGCPDFTIGTEASSSMNLFMLYTVSEDGKIARLCEKGIPASEKEYSIRFEQEEGNSALITYIYDNWTCELEVRRVSIR